MPWTERTIMDERVCLITAQLHADEPMSALCARFGISRRTGYKWLKRYRDVAPLVWQSSAVRGARGP